MGLLKSIATGRTADLVGMIGFICLFLYSIWVIVSIVLAGGRITILNVIVSIALGLMVLRSTARFLMRRAHNA